MKDRLKKWWRNPEYRKKQIESNRKHGFKFGEDNPNHNGKLLDNPKYLKKWQEGCQRKPNNLELDFLDFLKKHQLPFEYVGDFIFWIARKNPDFIYMKDKIIIELFGDYWHRNDNPDDLINHYAKYGWTCLVIWESEFRNLSEAEILSRIPIY